MENLNRMSTQGPLGSFLDPLNHDNPLYDSAELLAAECYKKAQKNTTGLSQVITKAEFIVAFIEQGYGDSLAFWDARHSPELRELYQFRSALEVIQGNLLSQYRPISDFEKALLQHLAVKVVQCQAKSDQQAYAKPVKIAFLDHQVKGKFLVVTQDECNAIESWEEDPAVA